MDTMYNIDEIIESLINGQFQQAKEQTMYRCKTRPMKLASRVGQVVGSLTDPDGFYNMPNLAVRYWNLFKE